MRLQTLLHGGPFDMDMVVLGSVGGEWPTEIRVGYADDAFSTEEIEAAVYHMTDEATEAATGVWFGSYRFVGMRKSSPALVQAWN